MTKTNIASALKVGGTAALLAILSTTFASAQGYGYRDRGYGYGYGISGGPQYYASGVVPGAWGTPVGPAMFGGDSYAYYRGPAAGDSVAYCQQRYRSYDAASGTFLGRGGRRYACP